MVDLSEYCAPGTKYQEEMIAVAENITLRVISFTPVVIKENPAVVFVAGWITLMSGWQKVLREMTKDFRVFYIETREKISSQTSRNVEYSVEAIGQDIVTLISHLGLKENEYVLFGSSLGATAILDCCRFLRMNPRCLVLIGPNAVFRVPKLGMPVIRIFYPPLYLLIKPVVKWYLRKFRLDVKNDYAQYEKYCNALDAADPWKLKKAVIPLSKYEIWPLLEKIEYPSLIIGASKDKLHEPANLQMMVARMKHATYLDMETNQQTHTEGVVVEMRRYLATLTS